MDNMQSGQQAGAGGTPPGGVPKVPNEEIVEIDIEIRAHAERGDKVPHARFYLVDIDCETVRIGTPTPTGEVLLAKVGKRPCAFELIEEFVHCENNVVEPGEIVDLRKHGLKGFITAHKELVTIFINKEPYQIERGERTVTQILSKVDETPEGYILLEEKGGPPLPLPPTIPVKICGCEVFHTQVQTGGSS